MTDQEFIQKLNLISKNTLNNTLDITYTEASKQEGWLKAKMPVTSKVHQPMGLLHGGVNFAIAETIGSAGSLMFVDLSKHAVVGIQMSGNHIKSKKEGWITALGKVVHLGKTTHLWEIKILDEDDNLLSLCRLTNLVIDKK